MHLLAEKTKSTKIFKNSLIGLLVIGISLPPRKYPKRLLIFYIIMANTRLIFLGSEKSETTEHELVCYDNDKNEIFIEIKMPSDYPSFIVLDKSTAIELANTLINSINLIKEEV